MQVTIQIETRDEMVFNIKNGSSHGLCCIEIASHKEVMWAEVNIQDLKLALKKLTTK